MRYQPVRPQMLKGAVAGFVGGLAGTFAMSEFQGMWSRIVDGAEPQSAAGRHDARDWQEKNEGQNANEIAAQEVATHTIDRRLTRNELKVAAPVVHYTFGSFVSAAYGGLAEHSPEIASGGGTLFGTAVWIAADEVAMPALGLAKRDPEYPLESHLQSLAAHLVFGFTTEMVRRGVRAALR